ncbi:MAG: AgmX/PglI C-terminal domain-containing protein [Candidatus Magnetomorum sp.]|nr:AgmX/PglI C-terminal domain-containing protein [Candidatus Magnetomorum sp.]
MKQRDHQKIYHVVFKNKLVSTADADAVQRNFISRFNVPIDTCTRIFSGRRVRIKKGINQQAALQLQDTLFQMGMICDIELDTSSIPKKNTPQKPEKTEAHVSSQVVDTNEDDLDDDIEANFDLAEILFQENVSTLENHKTVIEIIKRLDQKIIDIHYLDGNQKYVDTDRRFCLAEQKGSTAYFYFNDFIQGGIYAPGETIHTQSMKMDTNIYRKSKRIFKKEIPDQGYVELTDDMYTYHIRKKTSDYLPPQKKVKVSRASFFKHFSRSVGCHLVLFLLIGLFVSFEKPGPVEPKRFAKIASHKIHDLQVIRKKRHLPQPQIKQDIVTLTPETSVPPAKKIKTVIPEKKVAPQQQVAAVKKQNKSKASAQKKSDHSAQGNHPAQGNGRKPVVASRSSKKGSGNGGPVGNVSTPNVNQKGLLGLLKDTGLSLLPNDALAAVTQLDAVDVPVNFQKDTLKINGIKGHLGDAKIQIPGSDGGGRVNTKSDHQVLRTGGGDGSGSGKGGRTVGELTKGNTGSNAVKAMIRANFSASVQHIQGGGISRAAVKKVIDQHIDDITYCYEVALISDPSIIGKAVYEWRILMNGSVGDVHILNASIQNQHILGCIKKSIKTWNFPKPHQSQVLVSYPFVFDIVGF